MNDIKRRRTETLAQILYGDFRRCPTTNRVLGVLSGDDKVMCGCGRSNPKVPQEETQRTGTHIVRFLAAATAVEYLEQEQAEKEAR